MALPAKLSKNSTELTTGALIPQPHGGALRNGGTNRGGTGRMPSILRERLRGSFAERVAVLEDIADGECVQRARVPLAFVLPHVECPNCGEIGVAAKDPKNVYVVQIEAQVSASPADRTRAIDTMAKYGLGTIRDVSTDDVRDKNYALKLTLFAAEFLTEEQRVRLWRRLTKAYASGEKCTSDPDPSEVPV